MNNKFVTVFVSGVLVVGGISACTAPVAAQTSNITGSIQVQPGTSAQDLVGMAQISREDAVAAAQQAVGATNSPTDVELEVENGFLVWEVEFPGQEVVVDAGTGEVLLIEAEEAEGADDDDAGETEGPGEVEDDDVGEAEGAGEGNN